MRLARMFVGEMFVTPQSRVTVMPLLVSVPIKAPVDGTAAVSRVRNESGVLAVRGREGAPTPRHARLCARHAVAPHFTVLERHVSLGDQVTSRRQAV